MIAVTLQNYLKRLYLFPLAQNAVIRFRNKSFGSELKAHFFSEVSVQNFARALVQVTHEIVNMHNLHTPQP